MGTFYHTTNYNPLTGDLNNMTKTEKYVVDPKTGKGKLVAFTEMILPLINTTDWKRKGDNKRKDLRKKAGKRISA